MDIDQEHLGIPDTEYAATISLPSSDFRKICQDLMLLSESGMHIPSRICALANLFVPQSPSKPPKTESSSPALVILATVLSLSEAIPMSTSQISTSTSSSPNPSP